MNKELHLITCPVCGSTYQSVYKHFNDPCTVKCFIIAKLSHESKLKTFQNSSRCCECNSLNVEKDLILNEFYCYNCEKIVNTTN